MHIEEIPTPLAGVRVWRVMRYGDLRHMKVKRYCTPGRESWDVTTEAHCSRGLYERRVTGARARAAIIAVSQFIK